MTNHYKNIELKKTDRGSTDETFTFLFIDKHTKKEVGYLEYEIWDNDIAYIHSTYLFPEYRRKGILKHFFDRIITDIKCSGVDKLELQYNTTEAKHAWEHLGFRESGKKRILERDISNIKTDCNLYKL